MRKTIEKVISYIRSDTWSARIIVGLFLALVVFIIYGRYFPRMPIIDDWWHYRASLSKTNFDGLFSWFSFSNGTIYRPLYRIQFVIVSRLFDTHFIFYNLYALLLHVFAIYLVYRFAKRLTRDPFLGAAAGLLFALFAPNANAIYWISAVNCMWETIFILATLLFFMRHREGGGWIYLFLSMLIFYTGLLMKEGLLVLVVVLPLLDFIYYYKPSARAVIKRFKVIKEYIFKIPGRFWCYWLPLPFYFYVQYSISKIHGRTANAAYSFEPANFFKRIISFLQMQWFHDESFIILILVVLILLVIIIKGSNRVRMLTCWIVLSFVPFSFFTHEGLHFHYFYQPDVPFVIMICLGMASLYRVIKHRFNKQSLTAVAIAILFIIISLSQVNKIHKFVWFYNDLSQFYGATWQEMILRGGHNPDAAQFIIIDPPLPGRFAIDMAKMMNDSRKMIVHVIAKNPPKTVYDDIIWYRIPYVDFSKLDPSHPLKEMSRRLKHY